MRGLKILVVTMGILLIVGIVALVVGIAYRVNHRVVTAPLIAHATVAPNGMPHTLTLPADAKIVSIQSDGDRVTVRLALPDGGETLMLVDWQTGRTLSTIELRR
ncbi:MAG TPA: DUF6476 family protein [Stellaceae bacterium]